MTIDDLNHASDADFVTLLSAIYEHSPWVAARAADARPFLDAGALHVAMAAVVDNATADEQMGLIAAHPDLGGRLACAGGLERSSADEQASLGLDRLSDEEFVTFSDFNTAYRERFGFPFIIAVRRHTRNSVLAEFKIRLTNDAATERHTALQEIDRIARFRLDALLGD